MPWFRYAFSNQVSFTSEGLKYHIGFDLQESYEESSMVKIVAWCKP